MKSLINQTKLPKWLLLSSICALLVSTTVFAATNETGQATANPVTTTNAKTTTNSTDTGIAPTKTPTIAPTIATTENTSATTDNSTTTTEALTTANGTTTETPGTTGNNATTTKKPRTTAQAKTSTAATESPPPQKGMGVAGVFCIIILIVCLIGIGFCGYQFYRKRQNDDYHTL